MQPQTKEKARTAATVLGLRNRSIAIRNQKTSDASDYRQTTDFGQRKVKLEATRSAPLQLKFISSGLVQFPKLADRSFNLPSFSRVTAFCAGCDADLYRNEQIQSSLGICLNSLTRCANVNATFGERTEQQKRDPLKKLIGGKK